MYNERLVTFLQTKTLSYWIKWLFGSIAVLWLISLAFTYTIVQVSVTYHDGIKGQAVVLSTANGRAEEQAFSLGEITFLKRDTKALVILAENYQTDKAIDTLPLIGMAHIKANIYKDKDVRKYSGDNIGCTAYDKNTDTVLSYNCGKPANVVRYDRPLDGRQWQNVVVGTINNGESPINSVKPFRNGLLGLSVDIEPRTPFKPLFYIDSRGVKQPLNLPDDMDFNQWDGISIVTDQASVDSGRFLLVHRSGSVYLGTLEGSAVSYQKITLPNNYNNIFDNLSCRLLELTVYCYYGQSGNQHHDGEAETEHVKKNPGGTIFTTSPTGTKQYKVSDTLGIDELFLSRSKHLYALRERENMYEIELKDDKAQFRLLSQGVQSVGGGDGVLYIKDNAVFKVDDSTKESYLLFKSSHLRLSNVMIFGDDVFVNGYINDTVASRLHTYKISTQASTKKDGERLVDKLPFYIPDAVLDMDYADNIIRIRVNTDVTVNKSRNQLIYNPEEYEKNKEDILNDLSERGISSDAYDIIFSR